jgi:formylglycine-generating enzyme required for sulfatase activity
LVKTEKPNVYASLWEDDGIRLWTLVNRSDELVEGVLLRVPHVEGVHYFDLVEGRELDDIAEGVISIIGEIQPRGIGAFVSGRSEDLGADFADFLAGQAAFRKRANFDVAFAASEETVKPVSRTREYARDKIPEGVVVIPGARFNMEVKFRNRECGFYEAPELSKSAFPPRGLHRIIGFERDVQLKPYAIDATLVTNAQFDEFLKATGYRPRHAENFLKHWKHGVPPLSLEDHPVVYVDLNDARAYAKWAGKRLPTEEEWQYAAQGPDKHTYPWGDEYKEELCNDGKSGGTTSVTAFTDGRSPLGCYDMCGNVWEWTESERSDGRTRFCIIRGGSFYKAQGSAWYADGGPQPCNFAAKFILMWSGLDRCATIGFRCVVDIADCERSE